MDIMYVYNKVRSITGVLFINMCKRIIVGTDNGVRIIENK